MSSLSESLPLAGMAAPVTGGAGGIGRSTARLLVADGAHVVIAGRNPGHLQETADELGALGVRVNAVRSGLTATDATVGLVNNDSVVAQYLDQQPLQRIGHPDDIAGAIRFLAGPESSFTTGQFITVDGGHTLRSFVDFSDIVASRAPS